MKVYILMEAWEYEGADVVRVYRNREAAEAEAARLNEDPYYRVSYYIREEEVIE